MYYVGVDPGKKGAFAVISPDWACAYPWDNDRFVTIMNTVKDESMVCVESVHAMPGQGVSSMFSFGKAAGFIEGILYAYRIPYQLVPPRKWKKEYSLSNDKNQSIEVCKRLFPDVNLRPTPRCTKDNDGMAEAMLLAEYARRHYHE